MYFFSLTHWNLILAYTIIHNDDFQEIHMVARPYMFMHELSVQSNISCQWLSPVNLFFSGHQGFSSITRKRQPFYQ